MQTKGRVVNQCGSQLLDAVGRAAFGEFVGKVFSVVFCKRHFRQYEEFW